SLTMVKQYWKQPFERYVLLGLLLAPVSAALLRDEHHSLHAFSMIPFFILLSALALRELKPKLARATVALTALYATVYVIHYFTIYPPVSALAFENYGFKQTLAEALRLEPKRVVLTENGNVPHINLLFFGSLLDAHIPLLTGSRADL